MANSLRVILMSITYAQFARENFSVIYNNHLIKTYNAFIRGESKDNSFDHFRYNNDSTQTGFIEFRIAIKPTAENLAKAFELAYPILCNNGLHTWKFLNYPKIGKKLENWDIYAGDDRLRDQKGKELCCYISYNVTTKQTEKTTAGYKDIILKLIKAFIDNNIEFGYYPAQSDQRIATESGLPDIVTFISTYKTTQIHDGLTSDKEEQIFVDSGWQKNPLLEFKLTKADYLQYNISLSKLRKIQQEQMQYIIQHYSFAREKIHQELETFFMNQADNSSWLNQLSNLIAQESESTEKQKTIKELLEKHISTSGKVQILMDEYRKTVAKGNFIAFNTQILKVRTQLEDDLQAVKQEIIKARLLGVQDSVPEELDKQITAIAYTNPDKIRVLRNSMVHLAKEQQRRNKYYKLCPISNIKAESWRDRLIYWCSDHPIAAYAIIIIGAPLFFIPTIIFGSTLAKRNPNQILELTQALLAGENHFVSEQTKFIYSKFIALEDIKDKTNYLIKEIIITYQDLSKERQLKFLHALIEIITIGTSIEDEQTGSRIQNFNLELRKILPQLP